MKVYISPTFPEPDKAHGGIRRVVEAMAKHLPDFGIDIAKTPEEADLINCHAAAYVEHVGKPMVASCHGLYWTNYDWPDYMYTVNTAVIEVMARAQAVTAPSNWVSHAISRGMLVKPTTVYHGVDAKYWKPAKTYDNYVVWNKARADIISNPNDLHTIASLMPNVKFKSTIGNPSDNLEVLGTVPYNQMRPMIQGAAVYLATARETFGIGTLEALACGVPVAGWRFGGQEEIIKEGITGYLAPYGDYEALQQCIINCYTHRRTLSENARKDVLDRWLWPDKIKQYADIFHAVYEDWHKERPKTTYVVPCHNLGKYLPDTLASIAKQTDPDFECLIIDDDSKDNTSIVAMDVAKKDGRFTYHPTPHNLGLSGARNFGAELANGRYLHFVDADDILLPHANETLSKFLDVTPGAHIAYGKLDLINEDASGTRPGGDMVAYDWLKQMAHMHQFPIGGSMMRREVMARSGGFRLRDWRAEDASWLCRVTSLGIRAQMATEETIFYYRVRENSKSMIEARAHPGDADGDWTAWYSWRLAGSRSEGEKKMRKGIYPNAALVPFGAQARPPKQEKSWSIDHYQDPLVSIIIPVGPGHDIHLFDCLDSLLSQTIPSWEAIVVNDTGYHLDLSWAPWAKVINTEGATGAGAARNAGIAAARSNILLFLDADDWLLSGGLAALLKGYMSQDGAKYVYSNYMSLSRDGKTKIERMKAYDQRQWKGQHAVTILINKADVLAVGGFDEELGGWEDWDLPIKLAIMGFCGHFVPDATFIYRKYSGHRRTWAAIKTTELLELLGARYEPYYTGGAKMAQCCGGSQAGAENILRIKSVWDKTAAEALKGFETDNSQVVDSVRMQFVGPERGAVTYQKVNSIPLTKVYRGANSNSNRFINAAPADVQLLLITGKWKVIERAQPQTANIPQAMAPVLNIDPGPTARVPISKPLQTPIETTKKEVNTKPPKNGILITDKARTIAANNGVNLEDIKGTGANGRITVSDIRTALK